MRVLSIEDKQELGVLHTISSPILKVDDRVREIVDNMSRITDACETIGLSAVQLGYTIRVFVIHMYSGLFDPAKDLKIISGHYSLSGRCLVCINPEIVSFSGENVTLFEGCLSTKSYGLIGINRPSHVDLRYTDIAGNECVIRAYSWLSRCIQHEMDHLNGVLLANVVDNVKNNNSTSVSEEDHSSVHILLLDRSRHDG